MAGLALHPTSGQTDQAGLAPTAIFFALRLACRYYVGDAASDGILRYGAWISDNANFADISSCFLERWLC